MAVEESIITARVDSRLRTGQKGLEAERAKVGGTNPVNRVSS